jgi:hypothetical protein
MKGERGEMREESRECEFEKKKKKKKRETEPSEAEENRDVSSGAKRTE